MNAGRSLVVVALSHLPGVVACQGAPPSIEPCPILEASCQKQVLLGTDRLRGHLWEPWSEPPAVEVVSREVYQRRSEVRARRLQRAAGSDLWSGALQGLGLLAPDLDVATADHLWFAGTTASYFPWSNRVTIVDAGLPLPALESTTTLVHEYVHALQDRDLGLDWAPILTTDQEMVRTALIEGEAVLYARLAQLQMEGVDPARFDWLDHFSGWLSAVRTGTLTVPSPHSHVRLSFPYPLGGNLFWRIWNAGGVTRVQRLFQSPPRTSLELMLSAESRPPVAGGTRQPSCSLPRRVGDLGVLAVDTLGSALLYTHLLRILGNESAAWESALTWRGDRIWLLDDQDGVRSTFWRVRAPDLRGSPLGPLLQGRSDPPLLEGEDLLFWQKLDPEKLQSVKAALTCTPSAP